VLDISIRSTSSSNRKKKHKMCTFEFSYIFYSHTDIYCCTLGHTNSHTNSVYSRWEKIVWGARSSEF
jgi:hypothetical protein